MDYMDNVSKRIVSLREEKGETQQELANAIGITRQSLSRYEIAARTVSVEVLGALAQHFGVSADYLLGLSDVRSVEQDMQTACEVTGLTEKAIENIQSTYYYLPRKARESVKGTISRNEQSSEEEKNSILHVLFSKDENNKKKVIYFLESDYFEKIMYCINHACAKKIIGEKMKSRLLDCRHDKSVSEKDFFKMREEVAINNAQYKSDIMDTYELIKKFVETYPDSEQEANNHVQHHTTEE